MKILISTNDLKHDAEFNRLLGAYSLAKMNLLAYFNGKMSEDISSTPITEQVLAGKDGE